MSDILELSWLQRSVDGSEALKIAPQASVPIQCHSFPVLLQIPLTPLWNSSILISVTGSTSLQRLAVLKTVMDKAFGENKMYYDTKMVGFWSVSWTISFWLWISWKHHHQSKQVRNFGVILDSLLCFVMDKVLYTLLCKISIMRFSLHLLTVAYVLSLSIPFLIWLLYISY